jgi:hypothetical protein
MRFAIPSRSFIRIILVASFARKVKHESRTRVFSNLVDGKPGRGLDGMAAAVWNCCWPAGTRVFPDGWLFQFSCERAKIETPQ